MQFRGIQFWRHFQDLRNDIVLCAFCAYAHSFGYWFVKVVIIWCFDADNSAGPTDISCERRIISYFGLLSVLEQGSSLTAAYLRNLPISNYFHSISGRRFRYKGIIWIDTTTLTISIWLKRNEPLFSTQAHLENINLEAWLQIYEYGLISTDDFRNRHKILL